jgi:chromosome segregation ATPase
MTENQEKELFTTLATLVTGVRGIQTDVKDLKTDMKEVKQTLEAHSQALNRLEAKTDNIAVTVMANGQRLDNVEKEIDDFTG